MPILVDGTRRPGRRSLLGLVFASLVWAGPAIGPGRAQSAAHQAIQPINELYTGLKASMRSGLPFAQRYERLAPVIDRVFDLTAILQTSVGLRWSSLDEATRRTLSNIFRAFTIASYTANFDKDGGEKFEVLAEVRPSGSDVIAQSRLIASSGEPIRIDYLMRPAQTGWRVVDVLLDGTISRVAVQRSDFRALLASGDPAPLIASLRRKVAELSGGTVQPP